MLLVTLTTACTGFAPAHDSQQQREQIRSSAGPAPLVASLSDLPPVRIFEIMKGKPPLPFARFGQCQYIFSLGRDDATGLAVVPAEYAARIDRCLEIAAKEHVNVLIFPELALAFPRELRAKIVERIRSAAAQNDMLVIAGSFYDENRFSRIAVISGDGLELGYKLRPSRYEVSPRFGLGMTPGESLLVLHTPYGRLAVVTCVDLISDAVQFTLRSLATRGEIDAVININHNPAAWEFLVEANSLARRHPVFVSITNVAGEPSKKSRCFPNGIARDDGFCYGNSALFGSIRPRDEDCPNCFKAIEDFVDDRFKAGPKGQRSIPFDTMLADVPIFEETMLVYDLNLRMAKEPITTNAPDQGYPTIRGLRKIPLN